VVLLLTWCVPPSAFASPADFKLRTLDNSPTSLDAYVGRGNWVLVKFWASDCGICLRTSPEISALHRRHVNDGLQVVGVAIDGYDNLAAIQDYLNRTRPSFTNLVGELREIAAAYTVETEEGFRGTPTYLLYDPTGKLVGNNPGPVRPAAVEAFIEKHGGMDCC
jgi:thiol-disulfide isomerase/thioredoxin